MRAPFTHEYQNRIPDVDATDDLGRKIRYKGLDDCGTYNYVQSVRGVCGKKAIDGKNRRLGCTRRPANDEDGDYSGVLMDMVVANTCDINAAWFYHDTLDCVGLNPQTCPALTDESGGTIIEPRTLSNIEWKTKVSPPLMCSGDSHVCVNGDCEYIENVNPGRVLCTYKALDSLERVKAYHRTFQGARRDEVKQILNAYCEAVLQPTELTETQRKLYGDDFQCRTIEKGERAHQCTVHMGVGEAADFCRAAHLEKNYAQWTEARDNLIGKICNKSEVCQKGQNDAECLHECACYLRANDDDYPHGANPFKGSPDKCWWGPCSSKNFTQVWKAQDQEFKKNDQGEIIEKCPDMCVAMAEVSEVTTEQMEIIINHNCDVRDKRIVDLSLIHI